MTQVSEIRHDLADVVVRPDGEVDEPRLKGAIDEKIDDDDDADDGDHDASADDKEPMHSALDLRPDPRP